MTAIHECAGAAREHGVPIIADGGVVSSGDIVKAFVAGADAVMVGNALAGCDEEPGDLELVDGAMWKTYRGMGSVGGLRSGMGHAGAIDLDDLRAHTQLVRITGAGLRESHPHDVSPPRDE